ncbi:MAG: DM13 domain-containing protein [Chloroflexota bacterium]|nr:DM13 domain-containing protein [Chloroflexota bacterium]
MEWLGDLGSAILGGLYEFRVPVAIGSVVVAVGLLVLARRQGWLGRARRHPRASAAVLVPFLAIALPIGWYLTSPLVLSASINEPPPVLAAASAPASIAPSASAAPSASVAPSASAGASLEPGRSAPTSTPAATPRPAPTARPLLARSGSFHGSDEFHFGRGTARLIETAPGSFVVRLEDFAVRNGPDLYVYLSPAAAGYAKGAIELGRLKADTGNQNYVVPAGALADPSRAASVVIWCKQFSHLFATAPLGR